MSGATVIIEASDSGGSLHQGKEPRHRGRDLFISKSTVENPALTWLQERRDCGARVLSDDSWDDFLELLPARLAAQLDGGIRFENEPTSFLARQEKHPEFGRGRLEAHWSHC
jgi:DNA processing protein